MVEEEKKINPSPEDEPKTTMVGPDGLKVPHVGKKKTIPLNLFKIGPSRGGSLGNWIRKRK